MKSAITVIDQELIDSIQESIERNDGYFDGSKVEELLQMSKDLIEINAELTKREQKYKRELEHFVSGSKAIEDYNEIKKLKAEISELEKQGQWSSVECELPELNKTVMIDSGSGFDFARFNGDYWTRKSWPLGYTPKYWMPLPTPPEGE